MAATGTPTPNIGLRRAQGTDPASVDDINYNSAIIDTKLGAVGNSSVQDQIDTLNGKFTPNTFSQITVPDGTLVSGGYVKIGKIVILQARITISTTSYVIATGLPIPLNAVSGSPAAGVVGVSSSQHMAIDGNGHVVSGNGVGSGAYQLSCTYICQ